MPSGLANRLAPCHICSSVCGRGKALHGIEEHVAVRCFCCDVVDVDTRHAHICPRVGAQVNQHQPFLHAIPDTLKRLGILHQVESGEPFTADRNVTRAEPQAQIHLQGGSADHDGSASSTSEVRKRYARPGHVSFDKRSHKLATLEVESFGRLGVEGSNFIDQLAASVVGERDRGSIARKGVVNECLLQIVSVTK